MATIKFGKYKLVSFDKYVVLSWYEGDENREVFMPVELEPYFASIEKEFNGQQDKETL